MMNFRIIKAAIVNILGASEAGQFQTVGFQRQVKNAKEVLDLQRFVQVYYSTGDFSKQGGRLNGPTQHDPTYNIVLTCSKAATVDVATLNDDLATAVQKAAALAALTEAASLVDDSFDELADLVYQILMDGTNLDLGLPVGTVSNKWIDSIRKDDTTPNGEFVVLTGSMNLTLRTAEQVPGPPPLGVGEIIDTVIDLDGDDTEQTGVEVALT